MGLSANGISCAEDRVEAVTSAREPQNASETRGCLGLANYCGRLIPDLATISEPLSLTSDKGGHTIRIWKRTKRGIRGIEEAPIKFRAETLGYFYKDAATQIIADTSPIRMGSVLTQMNKDGQRIISYASQSLKSTETRYSKTEKEALAIIWACEKFHPYIYSVPFELVTGHKPLEVIYGPEI